MDNSQMMKALQDAMLKELLRKIEKGEATAADLNVARQYLKDNGIQAVAEHHPPTQSLAEKLPFTSHDEYGLPN
jgi:hypothetical protein